MYGTTRTLTSLTSKRLVNSIPSQSLAKSAAGAATAVVAVTTRSHCIARATPKSHRCHFHSSPALMAPTSTSAKDWSATQYLKFERERTRPARDLLSQISQTSPTKVIDLGSGPGNSTALLKQRFPHAHLTGLDSSPDMIAQARQTLPDIDFHLGDLQTYNPDPDTDVLFSNAVYQWLPPSTRLETLTRLLSALPSGATFAFQVPDNFAEPSHSSMRAVAFDSGRFPDLKDVRFGRVPFQSPAELYAAFKPLCSDVDIWHTSYYHVLENHQAIVEWVKGTGLRPYLDSLDDGAERQEFLDMYLAKIEEEYPALYDGKVSLKFPRLFVVAVRA